MDHAEPRYLEAKRSIDRRALSRRVQRALRAGLPTAPRVLEAGCGTGTTVPRLLSWGVREFQYRGIDLDSRAVAFARDVRPKELRRRGHDVVATAEGGRTTGTDPGLEFAFEVGDALERLPELGSDSPQPVDGDGGADLVVASAFLDLVPLEPAMEAIEAALVPGGLAYLPITFDGGTLFTPEHPDDDAVERAYHAAIDATDGRNSRVGRAAIAALEDRDGSLLAVDASDWIVRPRSDSGDYPADEAWFLGRILDFIERAVDPESSELSPDAFDDWLATRRRQLAAGKLVYVAHQYDLLYRTSSSTTPSSAAADSTSR